MDILKQRDKVNRVKGIFLLSDGLDNREGALQRVKETLVHSRLQKEVILHTLDSVGIMTYK